jgi:hypothetical protein
MWDLRKDVDVQYFINYLNTVVPGKWCFSEKELEKHKLAIEDKFTPPSISLLFTKNDHP